MEEHDPDIPRIGRQLMQVIEFSGYRTGNKQLSHRQQEPITSPTRDPSARHRRMAGRRDRGAEEEEQVGRSDRTHPPLSARREEKHCPTVCPAPQNPSLHTSCNITNQPHPGHFARTMVLSGGSLRQKLDRRPCQSVGLARPRCASSRADHSSCRTYRFRFG